MLKQIVACNGKYILTKVGTIHETQLGHNASEAKEKLERMGRSDIISQLY
jgi:hypothetical protein